MAEEFQTGICGGGSWWNAAKGGFDLSAPSVAAGASTASCSASVVSDAGGFGWSTMEAVEGRAPGYGEDSVAPTASGGSSSVTFQEAAPSVHVSYPMPGSGFLLESTLPMVDFGLSSPTTEWNQALHRGSGKIDLGGFHAMVQYDPSSRSYFRHGTDLESHQITPQNESMDLLKGMNNHGFIQGEPHVNSGGEPGDCTGAGSFPTLLQRLFDQEVKPQTTSSYDNRSSNFMASATSYDRLNSSEDASQAAWSKFPHILKVSPAEQPPPSPQLQFSNNTPFWNASEVAADARSGYYPLPQPPFATHRKFEEKPVGSTLTAAKCISGEKRSGKNETAFKKPRVETPSSLPTFKVRKEKLGDRITALQQLVSPFGKTDTASVLLEAIEYIKFLHDQVSVLSTPYLKSGPGIQQQQNPEKMKDGDGPKQDLRSRGLCLVPISSTFAVANEPISDFWTPTFGGITYK